MTVRDAVAEPTISVKRVVDTRTLETALKILAVDVGTGTQDILLFDTEIELENCFQMIMPSPTQLVASRVRQATLDRVPIFLSGVTMGGGPCAWAVEDHIRAGLPVFATPGAARTFDDDLENVRQMGVAIVAEGEVPRGTRKIVLRDFDYEGISQAFGALGVNLDPDAIAIAVFDHGAAPTGVSDRAFRFEYLSEIAVQNDLAAFAYFAEDIPPRLTRMRSVVETAPPDIPLFVMDTGPAAVLGALEDARVRSASSAIVVNVGNFHTLAFHVAGPRILGIFEHHTGELSPARLDGYLSKLGAGAITNAEVFADKGHGAVVTGQSQASPELVAVVGPRRNMLAGSALRPYFAVPHGDMMLAGCFGLLRALASRQAEWTEAISTAMDRDSV